MNFHSQSRGVVFPKRFETFIKIAVISALSFCLPVMAQEQNGWQFDSLRANSSVSKSDAQQVYEVLLKMLDRWNAHDIEGHLEVYWHSPDLLVVVDSEQFNGWQQLHDSYINGYPDRNSMGFIQTKRIQVKLLKPDLASGRGGAVARRTRSSSFAIARTICAVRSTGRRG